MKILIVEDEVLYSDVLVEACKRHGDHEIKTAGDLVKVDTVLQNFSPDLVISDNDLPDGRGPSRFDAIRKQNPRVFICLITGGLN